MDIFPKTGWMNLPISLLERYGFSHSELLPISTCYFIYTRYIRYIHVTYKLYITYVFHTIFYMNELYLNHLHHLLAGSVGPLPKLSLINCGRLAGSLLIEPATLSFREDRFFLSKSQKSIFLTGSLFFLLLKKVPGRQFWKSKILTSSSQFF